MAIKKSNTAVRVKKKSKKKTTKNAKQLIVAQEIKYARLLANSDKKVTDKVLKSLQKWLSVHSERNYAFTETDFLRLWKGLFYCVWMSDKPLVQEELVETISKLVHSFKSMDMVLLYTNSALKSLSSQWFGIDKYRVDKFDMLVRRIIRQTFVAFKKKSWDITYIKKFGINLEELMTNEKSSLGMTLQIIEVYMEELAKISGGYIPTEVVTELLRPFVIYMVSKTENREIKSVVKNIFRYLIFQSDIGLEYKEKFNAWKQAGFPCGSINDIQKIELSDEDSLDNSDDQGTSKQFSDHEMYLDPRAGRVDVELFQIPFEAKQIVDLLKEYKFHKSCTTRGRKQLIQLIHEFETLGEGEMPVGIKKVSVPKQRKSSASSKRAATRLLNFESNLYSDSFKNRKRKRTFSDSESEKETLPKQNKIIKKNKDKRKSKKQKKEIMNNEIESDISLKKKITPTKKHSEKKISLKTKKKKLRENKNLSKNSVSTVKKQVEKDKNRLQNEVKNSSINGLELTHTQKKITAELTKSMTPVIEKLDISHTNFIKQILKKAELVEKGTKIALKVSNPIISTPKTKGRNPLAVKAESETKKRVTIMLKRNTAQHTSDYLQQLKQSPAIPYDANRKPLTGVLKASPMPSRIDPFYKRKSV